jgi:hypothetical protein
MLLGLTGRQMPAHGALLKNYPPLELIIAIAVLAVASMCLVPWCRPSSARRKRRCRSW